MGLRISSYKRETDYMDMYIKLLMVYLEDLYYQEMLLAKL